MQLIGLEWKKHLQMRILIETLFWDLPHQANRCILVPKIAIKAQIDPYLEGINDFYANYQLMYKSLP